jgi:hypothetical protein
MTDPTGIEMSCDRFAEQLVDDLDGDALDAHAASCHSCGALLADLLAIRQDAAALPVLVLSRDLWSGIAGRIDAPVVPLHARGSDHPAPSVLRGWVRPAIAAAALVLFTASVTHVLTRAALSPVVVASTRPAAPRQMTAAPPAIVVGESNAPTGGLTSTASERPSSPHASREATRDARDITTPTVAHEGTVRLASAEPLLHDAEPVYDREISTLRRIVHDRHAQLDPATIAVLEQSVAVIDSAIAQSRAALAKDPASGFLAGQLNHSLEKKVELLRTAALLPART